MIFGLASCVWMSSLTRSMGAVAVFATAPATPPAQKSIRNWVTPPFSGRSKRQTRHKDGNHYRDRPSRLPTCESNRSPGPHTKPSGTTGPTMAIDRSLRLHKYACVTSIVPVGAQSSPWTSLRVLTWTNWAELCLAETEPQTPSIVIVQCG